ncbi:MAG: hypothetical protein AAGJ35_14425, partial [Myxococcota bacterium]
PNFPPPPTSFDPLPNAPLGLTARALQNPSPPPLDLQEDPFALPNLTPNPPSAEPFAEDPFALPNLTPDPPSADPFAEDPFEDPFSNLEADPFSKPEQNPFSMLPTDKGDPQPPQASPAQTPYPSRSTPFPNANKPIAAQPSSPIPSYHTPPPPQIGDPQQIEQWLHTGEAQHFLQQFFQQQHQQFLQQHKLNISQDTKIISYQREQVRQSVEQFERAAQQLSQKQLQDTYQAEIAKQVGQMPPEVLSQYIVELADPKPFQEKLRTALFESLPPEQIEASQQVLLQQLKDSKELAQENIKAMQSIIEQQVEQRVYSSLEKLVQQLERSEKQEQDPNTQKHLKQLLSEVASPEKIDKVLEEGAQTQQRKKQKK